MGLALGPSVEENFNEKILSPQLGSNTVGLVSTLPSHLFACTGEKFAKGAKVSIEQARAIALQTRVGVITDEELEHEKGGSGFRYSFDIKSGGTVYEVGVDARRARFSKTKRKGLTKIEDPPPPLSPLSGGFAYRGSIVGASHAITPNPAPTIPSPPAIYTKNVTPVMIAAEASTMAS